MKIEKKAIILCIFTSIIIPQLGLSILMPATPLIAQELNASANIAQLITTIYFAGYAFSMIFSGFFATNFGVKRTLFFGLCLFTIASILCSYSESWRNLIFFRFIQAFGGCSSALLVRLIIQKEFKDLKKVRILTYATIVVAITPCIAPLIGGWLTSTTGWRNIFLIMSTFSTIVIFMIFKFIPCDYSSSKHSKKKNISFKIINKKSMMNKQFIYYCVSISISSMCYISLLTFSSQLFQQTFNKSPLWYGTIIALFTLSYIAGSFIQIKFCKKKSVNYILFSGFIIYILGSTISVITGVLSTNLNPILIISIFIIMFSLGVIIPASQIGVLSSNIDDIETSLGVFFFMQLISGTLYSLICSLFFNGDALSFSIIIGIPSILFLIILTKIKACHHLKINIK